jgi:hypothetical protein
MVVGATTSWEGSAVDEQVVDYSSRGPTADGRVAPTLVAPSDWVTAPHHHDCRDVLGGFEIPDTDGSNAWFLGTSAATPDRLNTVGKLIAATSDRRVEITIRAAHLPGDGVPLNQYLVDQDFALVCDNCREPLPAPRRAPRRAASDELTRRTSS